MLHCPVHFPPVFLCLERLALVEHLLSTAQGNIHLCPAMVIDEDKGWDNGKAWRLGIFEEMPYLTLGEQQLAVALGLVVGIAAIEIWRYVHALHPHLALDNVAICVYKRGLAHAYGLYLGTRKLYASRIGIDEVVLEGGFLVSYLYGAFLSKLQVILVHLRKWYGSLGNYSTMVAKFSICSST